MATNWPQLVKPRACRSALCCLTAFSKLPRENNRNTCEKMLHTFIRLSLLWLNWFFDGTQSSLSGDSASYPRRRPRKPPVVSLLIWTAVIADEYNNRIRKVTGATGIISTVAGGGTGCTGQTDSVGDGCPATSAELNYPEGVAVDSAGNIYIADQQNSRIRKVTASTGIISTVAGNGTAGYSGDGGLATSAELGQSTGVAVDSAGNIYIADYLNSRIRKVTASTGIISTVAGNGTVGYSGDGGLATSAELDGPT